jgi:hypothetical protein
MSMFHGLQLINASVIKGKQITHASLATKPQKHSVIGADGNPYALMLRVPKGSIQIDVLDGDNTVSDVITAVGKVVPVKGCPRGSLYLVEDMLIPPSLRARILEHLDQPGSQCGGDFGGEGTTLQSEQLNVATTVAAGVNLALQTPSVRAIIPVKAKVDTKTTGADGKIVPLSSGVTIEVEASLTELQQAQADGVKVGFAVATSLHRISCTSMLTSYSRLLVSERLYL